MGYKILNVYTNYIDAHIAKGVLEGQAIDCWLKDENTVTIDPILTNAVGGIKLMVDEGQSEKAAGILRAIDNEQKAANPCPLCHSLNIELVSTPRKASNWLSVLMGVFVTSYAPKIDMVYHCFNCGHEFSQTGKEEDKMT